MFLKMKLSQPYDVIILFLVHVLDNEAAAGASHCDRMQRSTWWPHGVWNHQWNGSRLAFNSGCNCDVVVLLCLCVGGVRVWEHAGVVLERNSRGWPWRRKHPKVHQGRWWGHHVRSVLYFIIPSLFPFTLLLNPFVFCFIYCTGYCQGDGYRVGFGECRGKVLPAHPL